MRLTTNIVARLIAPASILVLVAATPRLAASQSGGATAAAVNALGVNQTVATCMLPGSGGYASADQLSTSLSPLVAGLATAVTTGSADAAATGVQSIASIGDLSLLGGVVRAARVVAVSNASRVNGVASVSANGSAFEGLVVNGVPMADPAPNTRVNVPGGYVMLNERVADETGITVNMIRVVLKAPLTGIKVGEIVVASAKSRL